MAKYKEYLEQLVCSFIIVVIGFNFLFMVNKTFVTIVYLLHFLIAFGIITSYLANKKDYFYIVASLSIIWKIIASIMIVYSNKLHFTFTLILVGWILYEILLMTKINKNKTINLL